MYDERNDNRLWDCKVGDPVILVHLRRTFDQARLARPTIDGVVTKVGTKYLTIGLPSQDGEERRLLYVVHGDNGMPKEDSSGRTRHDYRAFTEQTLAVHNARLTAISALCVALGLHPMSAHNLFTRHITTAAIIRATDVLEGEA